MENISLIDVNKPEKVQSTINELVGYANLIESEGRISKETLGLGNVDNTSDINKPISNAQQAALDEINEQITKTQTDVLNINKSSLGLGSVDNTADIDKPISRAQQEVLSEVDSQISQLKTELDSVGLIAKGAGQCVSFDNYEEFVYAFNSYDKNKYNKGQDVRIVTVNVPDLWVAYVENENVEYTFINDESLVEDLETNGYIQVGYYKLGMLETQKVDLTNHVTFDDIAIANGDYGLVKLGGTGTGVAVGKAGGLYVVGVRDDEIEEETTSSYRCVQAQHISKIVKKGMTNNTQEWTDEDKANARNTINAVGKDDKAIANGDYGLVKLGSSGTGVYINKAGNLEVTPTTGAEIESEITSSRRCLMPQHVSKIVKKGMTNNLEEWTEDDKSNARNLINAVGKDDISSNVKAGIAKADSSYGISVTDEFLQINKASIANIDAKTDVHKPIVPANLDYAIKSGLSSNKLSWTDSEKSSARGLLGAVSQSEVDSKIAELIGSDAETLETLQDLASAIEQNGDVIDSLNSAITSKASIESVNLLSERVSELENNSDGRQIELRASTTHIQWKYINETNWTDLIALSELKGEKGDKGDTGPQGEQGEQGPQGIQGQTGKAGTNGQDVELHVTSTHIQWKYTAEEEWINLIELSKLKGAKGDVGARGPQGIPGEVGPQGEQGPQGETGEQGPAGADGVDGREVEFQTSSTHIQWRYVGSNVWVNLVELSTLKGDKGDTGATGPVGARFEYDETTKTLNIITE